MTAIPGLEAKHTFDSAVTLNDPDATYPRFKVNSIPGLHDRADSEDFREGAQGREGEITFLSFLRGKTVVYEGEIRGRTLAQVRAGRDTLIQAFDGNDEKQMVLTYDAGYAAGGGLSFYYWARPIQCQVFEQHHSPNRVPGFVRAFIVGLRLSDGRIYQTGEQSGDTSSITNFAGITPPLTPPITLDDVAAGGSVVVTNSGSAPTDPTIDMFGPVTNPRIRNNTIGKELRFENYQIASGDFCRVDFKARTIKHLNVTDFSSKLDLAASDWWDPNVPGLQPGANTILMRGDTISDPAKATIKHFHANR